MTDANFTKHTLHMVATQAYSLAMGLQNAAPPQDSSRPAKSVQYLLETSAQLEKESHLIESLLS